MFDNFFRRFCFRSLVIFVIFTMTDLFTAYFWSIAVSPDSPMLNVILATIVSFAWEYSNHIEDKK